MEMMMSAVSVGAASQPQMNAASDSSVDSGFSDVLSDVRSSVASKPQSEPVTSSENAGTEQSEAVAAQTTVRTEESLTAEQPDDSFADALAELVKTLTEESGSDQDSVIRALLDILKKMQKNGDSDEINDAMELLMSMLGQNVCVLQPNAVAVTIPEPSGELAQITSEQPQTNAMPQNTVLFSENAAETGYVQQPSQESDPNMKADVNQQEIADNPEQAAQTAQNEAAAPVSTGNSAEQLLNELLSQARKELGLVKAEISSDNDGLTENSDSVSPEQPLQTERNVQSEQSFDTLALRLNHRDGTQELNSIIRTEEKNEISKNEIAPEQTVTVRPETAELQPAHEENPAVHAAPPEQQLAEEILSKTETLNGGRTEFTMELNPETLGKITVKLVSAHGRVEVSISAENEETGRLLQSRSENIGNALRENGIELERYQVVSEREDAQLMQDSYDGSSKNPYGRNDDGENSENQDDGEFLELLSQL